MNINDLIYGTSRTEHVVALEYTKDGQVELFKESPDGMVSSSFHNIPYWLVTDKPRGSGWEQLKGNLPLSHIKTFKNKKDWWDARKGGGEFLNIYDEKEAALILSGVTLFKGLEPKQVSVLSFDIETTGLVKDGTSKILLISNTFRRGNRSISKLFSVDEYVNEGDMLQDWARWVRHRDPSIILGHNIFGYDLPYMDYCARKNGVTLDLGRDGSAMTFNNWESKFRRDATQFYTYKGANIYGRQIVDTFFTAIKFDTARKYESYGLKQIIKQEKLEVEGRQFYDAGSIRHNWENPVEREKIKRYAEHDADDALKLFDLMIPAFFYLARSVPKTFTAQMQGASGGQINSILIRSYIQQWHSLPTPTETERFEGAISLGNPGAYEHVFKVDVASLYPSIMLQYRVSDKTKDPLESTLTMLDFLTTERLNNKRLAKETGKRSYKDLESAQKIIINSTYGLLGAMVNFNSPENAALVTKYGRDILTKSIEYATSKGLKIVNADTDSISISDDKPWPIERQNEFLAELNAQYPARIKWENDGLYPRVLVVKAKNYSLIGEKGQTIKGSALKASLKEPALKEFIQKVIESLTYKRPHEVPTIYAKYVEEILNLKDITRWVARKTITSAVLTSSRTNEAKVRAALEGTEYSLGDKLHFYFDTSDALKLSTAWKGDHDSIRLLEKLYSTLLVFESVYNVKECLNFALVKNQKLLSSMK